MENVIYLPEQTASSTDVSKKENKDRGIITDRRPYIMLVVLLAVVLTIGIRNYGVVHDAIVINQLEGKGAIFHGLSKREYRFLEPISPTLHDVLSGVMSADLLAVGADNDILDALGTLEQLRHVKLSGSGITEEAVTKLVAETDINSIFLLGCDRIDEQARQRIRNSKSNLEIDWETSTYLGVVIRTNVSGCYIWRVERDTPADKAGLKSRQAIIGIGSEPISDFRDLRRVLDQHQPRDTIEIHLTKTNGQVFTTTATLGHAADHYDAFR